METFWARLKVEIEWIRGSLWFDTHAERNCSGYLLGRPMTGSFLHGVPRNQVSKIPGQAGDWNARYRAYLLNEDGSIGQQITVGSNQIHPGYYWNAEAENDDFSHPILINPSSETETVLIKLDHYATTPAAGKHGMTALVNPVIYDGGEIVGYPCMDEELGSCAAMGGNMYLSEPVIVDGIEYSGCVYYDGCVSDLPLALARIFHRAV